MATLANGAPPRASGASKRAEHIFYTGYLVAIVAIVFVGFAPSFYLRGVMAPPRPLLAIRADMIVHGILASVFMLGFPVQGWLAGQRRLKAHIALGKLLFVLGALMVPGGYWVASQTYHRAVLPVPDAMVAGFMAFPLWGLVLLAVLLALAWRHRFEAQVHKRLMIVMACLLADPAIARTALFGPTPAGIVIGQLAMFATLLPLFVWDLVTVRKLHRATVLGAGLFLAMLVGRTLVLPTAGWAALVHALPLFGAR